MLYVLCVGILIGYIVLFFLPLWLSLRYKQSQLLEGQTEENKFVSIGKSWLLMPTGLVVSIACMGSIFGLLMFTPIATKYFDHSIPPIDPILLISLLIAPLFAWLLPLIEFLEHKKDYIYFYPDKIAFRLGRKKHEVMVDQIQEVKETNGRFLFSLKTGEKIAIKMNVLDNFVGAKQLSEKLNTINASK